MVRNRIIYTGPIYKLEADEIVVEDETVYARIAEDPIIDTANFYYVAGGFMNMEYGCILPNKDEAENYLCTIIENRKERIKKVLLSEDISENKKKEFIDYIKSYSSCIFFNKSELKESFTLNKEQFKTYKKDLKLK